jgi:hypothetical protein
MPLFQSGLTEIEALKERASPEQLRSFFRQRIREWGHPTRNEECFTVGVFDDLASAISPAIAFDLLPAAVSIARDWLGSEIIVTALALIETLARRTNTTEKPAGLLDLMAEIAASDTPVPSEAIRGVKAWNRL